MLSSPAVSRPARSRPSAALLASGLLVAGLLGVGGTAASAGPAPSARTDNAAAELSLDRLEVVHDATAGRCFIELEFTDASPGEVDQDPPRSTGPDGLPLWWTDVPDFDGYAVAIPAARVPGEIAVTRRVTPGGPVRVAAWDPALADPAQEPAACPVPSSSDAWEVFVAKYVDGDFVQPEIVAEVEVNGVPPLPFTVVRATPMPRTGAVRVVLGVPAVGEAFLRPVGRPLFGVANSRSAAAGEQVLVVRPSAAARRTLQRRLAASPSLKVASLRVPVLGQFVPSTPGPLQQVEAALTFRLRR